MVLAPPAAALASAIDASVLLPIPGAPPSSTSEPGRPAPQHAVELSDPGQQPRAALGRDRPQRHRLRGRAGRTGTAAAGARRLRRPRLECVPSPAAGALAGQGQRRLAALGAGVSR